MKLTKDQQQSLTILMKPQNAILLIPCLLAGPTLIAVLLYEVIQYKTLSESDKESLHTAEYVLSFLSSLVLFVMVFYSIIGSLKYLSVLSNLKSLLIFLIIIALSPFGFTVLKIQLDAKLSEESRAILSSLIIVWVIPVVRYSVGLSIGM